MEMDDESKMQFLKVIKDKKEVSTVQLKEIGESLSKFR